jgi:hypothetical protein
LGYVAAAIYADGGSILAGQPTQWQAATLSLTVDLALGQRIILATASDATISVVAPGDTPSQAPSSPGLSPAAPSPAPLAIASPSTTTTTATARVKAYATATAPTVYIKAGTRLRLPIQISASSAGSVKAAVTSSRPSVIKPAGSTSVSLTTKKVTSLTLKAGARPGKATVRITPTAGKALSIKVVVTARTAAQATYLSVTAPKTISLAAAQAGLFRQVKVADLTGAPSNPVARFTVAKAGRSVLTVSEAGVITAKKTGTARITVKVGGRTTTVKVKVTR